MGRPAGLSGGPGCGRGVGIRRGAVGGEGERIEGAGTGSRGPCIWGEETDLPELQIYGAAGLRSYGATELREREASAAATPAPAGPLTLTTAGARTEGTTDGEAIGRITRLTPPPPLDQLPYESDEFGRFERLGEKRVDADVEPAVDLVLGTGADDGEGQITGPGIATQPSGGTQPVQPRHHDIEGDHIGLNLVNDIQTLGTIGRGHDLETLQLEIDPDQLPDDLVVVHNKHPTRRAWHNSRVGPDRPPRPGFPHFHPLRATRPASPPTFLTTSPITSLITEKPVHGHP